MKHTIPLAGIDHPDALYRAAIGDGSGTSMTAKATDGSRAQRVAVCPCCSRRMNRVMRVRVTNADASQARWMALCAMCAASMLATNPRTIVGGRIRPRLRSAS